MQRDKVGRRERVILKCSLNWYFLWIECGCTYTMTCRIQRMIFQYPKSAGGIMSTNVITITMRNSTAWIITNPTKRRKPRTEEPVYYFIYLSMVLWWIFVPTLSLYIGHQDKCEEFKLAMGLSHEWVLQAERVTAAIPEGWVFPHQAVFQRCSFGQGPLANTES